VEVEPVLLGAGAPCDPSVFDGADGLVVGGGLTPGYWEGLAASAGAISAAVAGGVPYLGFSAGAMIAPHRALLGGYLSRGIEVCGEECSEGLAELDIRDSLGLAPFALVLASAGDENFEVLGHGNCWDIRRSGTACIVSVLQAD
jgi:cyanophycinase